MATNSAHEALRQAAKAADVNGADVAIEKALTAGVPIQTILQWLFEHGPAIVSMIQQLIDSWKKTVSPPAPAPK